ncbi:family 16 glycosylhydrolase [Marivirga arenosa]|uniref:Family 16 glycosylhydrolase n=1 Tax=Marivirga arenosa TaxID=3059076 RepID=A0AA51N5C0_9BACT|nr:family 16 glycosylhydrolase [Marivirga sp. ABR2-2]WMN06596.1 family 16 glycosylhydrolase [Marivirga sp. ABR2-2]
MAGGELSPAYFDLYSKIIMMLIRLQLILCSFLFISCSESDDEFEVLPPSNLNVEVVNDSETPGKVTVYATAENTNYFSFSFGDNTDIVENKDGDITHSYSQEGEFEITVKAHATVDVYTSKTQPISIVLTDGEGVKNEGYESPLEYEGFNLVWQDEFDSDQLSDDYTFEIGTGSNGWGNNELQYYKKENTRLEDGFLVIQAKKENFGGRQYTSSRIITEGKKEFKYGRIDIRARMPYGQGIWPALWMLGGNFREVGWPFCGEIDIMEMIGGQGRENTVHGTVHWQNNDGYANFGHKKTLTDRTLSEQFHVFSIIWDENHIEWLIDNEAYGAIDITPSHLDEFREEFFFIFNVAVGGNWPGSPNEETKFPQEMWIDYIRVFQP